MPPVWNLPPEAQKKLYRRLKALDYLFAGRPHQTFLARGPGVVVNAYLSGKVVLLGSNAEAMWAVEAIIEELGGTKAHNYRPPPDALVIHGNRIGTDESGKGDYFGPLVVAGVLLTSETERQLRALGVRDSKELSDPKIASIAHQIREIAGPDCYYELVMAPEEYNRQYDAAQGVGALLGWAHAHVVERILEKGPPCSIAIADQFGDERHIKRHLEERGRTIRLLQTPRGERDLAVAAASVLARDRFVRALDEMGQKWGFEFPRGSAHVVDAGVDFVRKYGEDALTKVAKVHFRTTAAVTAKVLGVA